MNNLQAMLALINGKPLKTLQGHPDKRLKYIYYERHEDLIYDNCGRLSAFEPRISKWQIYQESKSEKAEREARDLSRHEKYINNRKEYEHLFNEI